ncbi:hypothetical protein J2S30_004931 [Herbaspirillum rubrisubalbicans]|nr:hypothetical protein [Herbaspirillum rubrisubalbicans]
MMVSPGFNMAKNTPWLALGAGVGLHVGGFGAEQGLQAVDGQLFGHVHVFAATVVALARIAFGVLVGQLRTLRFHHGRRGVVFRGDQLDVILLAGVFLLDGRPQVGIDFCESLVLVKHGVSPN